MNHLERLHEEFGQSPWIDDLSRDLIISGKLQSYIDQGIRGLTSNPTILEHALKESNAYDQQISSLVAQGLTTDDIYISIVSDDIKSALHLLRPLWDASNGEDGFVSLEVSPTLANDTSATIAQAQKLWQAIDAPNLMIKVPATEAGIAAGEALLTAGNECKLYSHL